MLKKRVLSSIILCGVLLLSGCGAKEPNDKIVTNANGDKYYSASGESFDLEVDTKEPIYLEGFIYPYYYNLVNFENEPKTVNVVQEKDEHGKFYPYSYSLCTTQEQKDFYKAFIIWNKRL